MKIIYTTDLHGNRDYYDKLVEVAAMAEADMVINGGDMLPKGGDMFAQGKFIPGFLDEHMQAITANGTHYLCALGNDDLMIFDNTFETTCNKYPLVTNIAQRLVEINGIEFVGMNWVVDYPFRLKDRCRMDTKDYIFQQQLGTGLLATPTGWEELPDWQSYAATLPTLEDEIKNLPRPNNMQESIYIIHMPPYGIGLDECRAGKHIVGSRALTKFFADNQPRYSLHGHIHESPQISGKWQSDIGNTTCIQPGQGPKFTYVTIDTQSGTLHRTIS